MGMNNIKPIFEENLEVVENHQNLQQVGEMKSKNNIFSRNWSRVQREEDCQKS